MNLTIRSIARLSGHNAAIFALAPFGEPGRVLSAAGDGWIVRWDLENPELGRLVAKVDAQIFSLCYLPDSARIVAGNMNGGVHWVDVRQPDHTRNIAHHQKGVYAIQHWKDSVFTIGGDGVLTRWSATEGRSLESVHLSAQSLRSLALHQDGKQLAVGASDHNIYILDLSSLQVIRTLRNAHENSVFSLQYHPNGRYLLSGGRDAHLRIWDLDKDLQEISAQPAHWFTINDIAFHPEGHLFATASRDKTIKIWDADSFQLLKVIEAIRDRGHVNSVNRLYWSSYHNYLLSASDDRTIGVWEIIEGN
ncbi:MAG: WD40 repeat domain-containing protein [Saprospiraceae bacterium]|nr:WD40 repeat domain-containing protein [Lewinella sp.]